MIDPEQERVLQRARLLRQRAAALRRRRAIAEVQRQIEFEALWADPRRRAAYDHWRRLFHEHRPHLYEPVPKMTGRRTLLASLGALLATPALAEAPALHRSDLPHRGARPSGARPEPGSRVDVRDFSTAANPYRGGSDAAPAIQAAIDYAAAIGGVTVYLDPGPLSFTGSQGADKPALSWTA